MEVTARGTDTYRHLLGVVFLNNGQFTYTNDIESLFPAYGYAMFAMYKVMGASYFLLPKVIAVIFHIALPFVAYYFFAGIFEDKKLRIFGVLLFLSFTWETNLGVPSYEAFGIMIFMYFFGSVNNAALGATKKVTILILLVLAMSTSDPAPALAVLLIIVFLIAINSFRKRRLVVDQYMKVIPILLLGLVARTVYGEGITWVLNRIVLEIESLIQGQRNAASLFTQNLTSYRIFEIGLVLIFLTLMGAWMVTILNRRTFWRQFSLDRVSPLLIIVPILGIALTGFFTNQAPERVYALATPFLAWFFATESKHLRKLGLTFLIVFLLLNLALAYPSEYAELPPVTEFVGAHFVVYHMNANQSIYYVTDGDPPELRYFAGSAMGPTQFSFAELIASNSSVPNLSGSIDSLYALNFGLHNYGYQYVQATRVLFDNNKCNLLYSTLDFADYGACI